MPSNPSFPRQLKDLSPAELLGLVTQLQLLVYQDEEGDWDPERECDSDTIHSFRHYFVSEAFRQGATEAEIKDWVGHRSSEMVHHYRHLRPDDSQRRMQSINFISDDTVSSGNQPEPEVPRESQEG